MSETWECDRCGKPIKNHTFGVFGMACDRDCVVISIIFIVGMIFLIWMIKQG